MSAKLRSVVRGNGPYSVSVWEEQSDYDFGQRLGMLSLWQPLHQYHVCASFSECDNGTLAVFSHDGIHLPVTETSSVSFGRSLVYAYAVGDVLYSGGTVGLRSAGMRIREMLEAAIDSIMQMDSPLLIFDEGDKLNDNVFHYFINLYNRLEGKCGMVFMSTSYIEQRIERGVSSNRKGYNEIYSRIGRRFFELEPTSAVDVAAICHANGLSDRRHISEVIGATEKAGFDLRCVKGAIHRAMKVAEASGAQGS